MEQEYRIGQHRFDSEEEYRAASTDYEYTKRYMEELDLRQPAMAKRLYEKLEQSNTLMRSEVGEAFKDKLVQIFVQDAVSQGRQAVETEQRLTIRQLWQWKRRDAWMRVYQNLFLTVSTVQLVYYAGWIISQLQMRIRGQINQMMLNVLAVYRFYGRYLMAVQMLFTVLLLVWAWIQNIRKQSDTIHCMNILLGTGLCCCVFFMTLFL